MSETTTTNRESASMLLYGRRDIYTPVDDLTEANLIDEVNSALTIHFENVMEEDYLYWYRRGIQPVLYRTKDRNEFILNKIIENHAAEVCDFKNGFFLQAPATFVSRKGGKKGKVDKLNEYLYRSGKHVADNQLADWFHTVGKAALYVEPTADDETPLRAYALDPRSAFVVYSMKPGNRPVYAVNVVIDGNKSLLDVYTDSTIYRLSGSAVSTQATAYKTYETTAINVEKEEPNYLGHIPIIEYRYNSVNCSAFEQAITLFDSINDIQSNRADGISQFIQSIAVAVNCQFDEGVTAEQIKKAGMIALSSIGENKADFKILSEELNQEQTQTLVDNLYDQALRICAMPSSAKSARGSFDATGLAAIYNNGWEQAGASARNTEDLFKESDRLFEEILIDVLKRNNLLDIKLTDFELNFVREETANIQSKAQAAHTMLAMGLAPELALKKSGLSNDPVSDVKMSEKYLRMIWGDPDKVDKVEEQTTGQGEAVVVEETNSTDNLEPSEM